MHVVNPEAIGEPGQTPIVQLDGDVRDNSRAYGLPVVTEDGYTHAPECYWCDGKANSDACPRSVFLAGYVERLRANDPPAGPVTSPGDGV